MAPRVLFLSDVAAPRVHGVSTSIAVFRRLDFDLVHVQTPFAAHLAGRRIACERGVPLVETWHTDFEHYFEHYLPLVPAAPAQALARQVARRVGRDVDRLVVPSSQLDLALAEQGTRDLLEAGRGALVPADDVEDFAVHLVRLLRDAGLRHRLGAEARELAGQWSARAFAHRLAGLYRELIEGVTTARSAYWKRSIPLAPSSQ